MIEFVCAEQAKRVPSIKVVGVGGAGGNTVNSLISIGCDGICCIAANTDAQALEQSQAHRAIQLGVRATKGLGAGANPDIGRAAAEENLDCILEEIGSTDLVFLTAGMGGGTGSGALPVIAQALKEHGILTIAIVTTPFYFEGKRRIATATQAISELQDAADALIVIPNQRLLETVDKQASLLDAFAVINAKLSQTVKAIADVITKPGYINVDFADLKTIIQNMGIASMGSGSASGENRAKEAAMKAIQSPLVENFDIQGARRVLINISGGFSMRLHEVSEAASVMYEQASQDAQIIVGAVIDERYGDDITVTVIATGFTAEQHATQQESDDTQVAIKAASRESKKTDKGQTQDLDVPTFIRKKKPQHVCTE